jgi:hypothetical protein
MYVVGNVCMYICIAFETFDIDENCNMARPLNVYGDESHENHDSAEKSDTLLCAAVGTASHQHGLEVCTVYRDRTVCSCRHSKSFTPTSLY